MLALSSCVIWTLHFTSPSCLFLCFSKMQWVTSSHWRFIHSRCWNVIPTVGIPTVWKYLSCCKFSTIWGGGERELLLILYSSGIYFFFFLLPPAIDICIFPCPGRQYVLPKPFLKNWVMWKIFHGTSLSYANLENVSLLNMNKEKLMFRRTKYSSKLNLRQLLTLCIATMTASISLIKGQPNTQMLLLENDMLELSIWASLLPSSPHECTILAQMLDQTEGKWAAWTMLNTTLTR